MKISDQQLRTDRLVFYAQDVHRLDGELDSFLELSGAKCALLIDCEGHLVTRRGEAVASSVDSLSALTAGSFAATRSAYAIDSSSSRSFEKTRFTYPSSSASRASTNRLSNRISRAFRWCISHGTEKYWKLAGRNIASSAANTTSIADEMIQPAKIQ